MVSIVELFNHALNHFNDPVSLTAFTGYSTRQKIIIFGNLLKLKESGNINYQMQIILAISKEDNNSF